MPWCLKCREEYRNEFTKCSECNEQLFNELETLEEDVEDMRIDETFLVNVADEMESYIIGGLLNSFGIPVTKKYRENGDCISIYMGKSIMGIDLFVPSDRLKQAKDIISQQRSKLKLKIKGPKSIDSLFKD